MFKRSIKYTDFDGIETVDVCYFNMTKTEILQYQAKIGGNFIQIIVDSKDMEKIIREIQNLVLAAYGIRSEDGKRFIKNDQIREEFTQTAAYDALFMELATDDKAAAEFILGIVPPDMRGDLAAELSKSPVTVPTLPPPAPSEV